MISQKKTTMLLRRMLNAMIYVVPVCLNTRAFMTRETEDNLAWIKYWIVFSLIFALEILLDFNKSRFPCYDYLKVVFLGICILSIEINLSTFNDESTNNLKQVWKKMLYKGRL